LPWISHLSHLLTKCRCGKQANQRAGGPAGFLLAAAQYTPSAMPIQHHASPLLKSSGSRKMLSTHPPSQVAVESPVAVTRAAADRTAIMLRKRPGGCATTSQPRKGVTRPPEQGGSAGAVDTALATLGYGYGSWFGLSKTLCDLHLQRRVRQAQSPTGRQRPRALHTELKDPVRSWPTQRKRTVSVEIPRTLSSRRGLCLAHTAL
jgi:hypothetical protein